MSLPPAITTPDPAAFAHVRTWVFDLDNTLYPAACNLFAQIDERMTEFISRRFDLEPASARELQKRYYREYGTTLRGLMMDHDIDPAAFLDFVHDIDVTPVPPAPALATALSRLPGRKLVYTNGSERHAANVLGRLGIADRFEAVYDIVAADYLPKPDPRPYAAFIERHQVDPAGALMVEDIARNLAPAAAIGMTTLWVVSESDFARPDMGGVGAGRHIHHATDDLVAWLVHLAEGLAGDGPGARPGARPGTGA
ncbi:pyrimidine 5'-nucleotidase [Arenibaculum pallidiluteum]|uniref:pyrimidine 5'-nucleotidase n=1 Tax=Arenibaculum pallidiluteum TaxID=2812559 RepID=UPI001A95AF81|nr:pyrimidine 5'-nucleotidase [Arenibaculum pallidiluteum]